MPMSKFRSVYKVEILFGIILMYICFVFFVYIREN
jgi:hypothetical protein